MPKETWQKKGSVQVTRNGKGRFITWKKIPERIIQVYRTTYIVNAKGSGIEQKREPWSFTTDSTIYTFAPIDDQRFEAMAHLCHALSEWICDDLGFHNVSFNTVGTELDRPSTTADTKSLGFYICTLGVEDTEIARGNFRYRQLLKIIVDDMLDAAQRSQHYSYQSGSVVARVSRVHFSTVRGLVEIGRAGWGYVQELFR